MEARVARQDPIDDIDEPDFTSEHVTRRVDDWLERLGTLIGQIRTWAQSIGWAAEDGTPIPMDEEFMRRAGLPAREQPTLSVRSPDGAEVWIKPKGLWVIGANGRVDLYSRKGAFTLVDTADEFQTPRWILHRIGKTDGQPFDPAQLRDMV